MQRCAGVVWGVVGHIAVYSVHAPACTATMCCYLACVCVCVQAQCIHPTRMLLHTHLHPSHPQQVLGAGMSADAYHMTQPPADGRGAVLAMQRALSSAGASPSDVLYLNAHATSTPIGDDVEQTAIATVFGAHATEVEPDMGGLMVSSTKGATGHLLGAAGAMVRCAGGGLCGCVLVGEGQVKHT